ncbi:MAG: CRISPR-associated helicase Cas3' [Desulfitobacteriaceae bacterium]
MVKYKPLLAKSVDDELNVPYGATLVGHLEQTLEVAEAIIECLGQDLLSFGGKFSPEHVTQIFRIAAVLHDLAGKATCDFQRLVRLRGKRRSAIVRHEFISDWALFGESGHQGLKQALNHYVDSHISLKRWGAFALRSAIIGHHLKFNDNRLQGTVLDDEEGLAIHWNHPDMLPVKHLVERVLGEESDWTDQPRFHSQRDWIFTEVCEPLEDLADQVKELNERERQLCSLIRGLLVSADTLASFVSETRDKWIQIHLPAVKEALSKKTLSDQLSVLIHNSEGKIFSPNQAISDFQSQVANAHSSVTLVEGACGTGKTLAAYQWAVKHQKSYLYMMYPTTATATQGYVDYALTLGDDAQLVHSRSSVDVELLDVSNDVEESSGAIDEGDKEHIYQALEHLNHTLTICTADQVLGIMQNFRSSLILLPVLLQSALVFDEIHSYDDMLFLHLIRFLKTFKMPVLLMTASLQPERRRVLEEILNPQSDQARQAGMNDYSNVKGPSSIEKIERYQIKVEQGLPAEWVKNLVLQGEKVLIVINSVSRAVQTYEMLKNRGVPTGILNIYHSRFKYLHRLERQRQIVKAFKVPGPCCVITTQICEMSFDVSASYLFSEIAPFEAMIQRLGRLNRYAQDSSSIGKAWLWMPAHDKPYLKDELEHSLKLLKGLSQEASVSQELLSRYQSQYSDSAWNDSKPYFAWEGFDTCEKGRSLRDNHGLSLDYIVKSDFSRAKEIGSTEILKYIIPMLKPKTDREHNLRRWRHVRIIEDDMIDYSIETGGRWVSHG